MAAGLSAQDFSIIARTQVAITASLDHHELATYDGLLSLFWHHRTDSEHRGHQPTTVLFCGGALRPLKDLVEVEPTLEGGQGGAVGGDQHRGRL